MKKIFSVIVVLTLIALAVPSMAEDKKPYNWTGFYIGINGGYGWGDTNWNDSDAGKVNHAHHGGMVGGTAGANLQLLASPGGIPAVVGGIETDFDWSDMDGSRYYPTLPILRAESSIDALATVRGRLGLAFDRLLVFGTGGLAVAKVNIETVYPSGFAVPPSDTPRNGKGKWDTGYVVGAGAEYAFWNNLSLKVEYQYYDLGHRKYKVDFDIPVRAGERGSIVRSGINYKF